MNEKEIHNHITVLIWCIDEFLDPSHPIRHSSSYLKLKSYIDETNESDGK